MDSLYDELREKLKKDPRLTKRSTARYDLGLLLFNAGDDLRDLWAAAERHLRSRGDDTLAGLEKAVEKLRPLFGARNRP